MRKLLAILATTSAVALAGIAAPTPAQAATLDPACVVSAAQDNEGVVLVSEHGKHADATSPILTDVAVTGTGCPAIKSTTVTVVLPGKDLTGSSKDGKRVSIRVRPSALKAGKVKPGVDYKVRNKVTFAGGATFTKTTSISFMQDTRIVAKAVPAVGGTATISGTLSYYKLTSQKWVPLTGKTVYLYSGTNTTTNSTTKDGKFSFSATGLVAGTVVPVRLVYGAIDGGNLYGTSTATVTFTAK